MLIEFVTNKVYASELSINFSIFAHKSKDLLHELHFEHIQGICWQRQDIYADGRIHISYGSATSG